MLNTLKICVDFKKIVGYNKVNKFKKEMFIVKEERIKALANYLDVELDELECAKYDENLFIFLNEEYLVLTEEEAYEEVKQEVEEYAQFFNDSFLSHCADDELLEEVHLELALNYVEDLSHEEGMLEQEMCHYGASDKEELAERIKNESMLEGAFEYLFNNFGKRKAVEIAFHLGALDIDYMTEEAIQADGRGHFISSYDGVEIEQDGFFIYRIN